MYNANITWINRNLDAIEKLEDHIRENPDEDHTNARTIIKMYKEEIATLRAANGTPIYFSRDALINE
jgi:hypothetical protein